MNAPVIRVFAFLLLLMALVVAWSSRWAVFDAEELEEKNSNRRLLIEEQGIRRGTVTTADGFEIAKSVQISGGSNPVYAREYFGGTLYGNPVGYNFIEVGRSGIESSENELLIGETNEFSSLIDEVLDKTQEGDDLTLTIDSEAQEVAARALQDAVASTPGSNGAGSVVALDPNTGAVRVMVSIPGFNANEVADNYSALSRAEDSPLFNRPTQSTYQPGSTMKVMTAAAALDSGEFTPETTLSGETGIEISGVPLENAGGESFGEIPMTTALTNSVNTYWAQVGEQLGTDTMFEYMDRFGFNEDPELDYPDGQMAPSGVYGEEGELLGPSDTIDMGRVAIGQANLLTTPLQMAQVVAAVANDGVLMQPTFLQEARDPDGRVTEQLGDGEEQEQVVSEETAAQLTEMMTSVTAEGTAAGLTVGGVPFAGKTGTAEIDVEASLNRPWFIGFAPADDPQVAVAVMLEECTGCFGGEVAGPIATQVMEILVE